MSNHADLLALLSCTPTTPAFRSYLKAHDVPDLPEPQSYPDAVYFSAPSKGISFVFDPVPPYQPKYKQRLEDLQLDSLRMSAIDLYSGSLKGANTFATSPLLPLRIPFKPEDDAAKELELTPTTSGRELVEVLGEPDRKGGGSQRVAVWLEWTSYGLKFEMVRWRTMSRPADVLAGQQQRPRFMGAQGGAVDLLHPLSTGREKGQSRRGGGGGGSCLI
jgi:hypothetical protein